MANGVNCCHFVGNVGADPEVRETNAQGLLVANFRIAVNRSWKDGSGEKREATEWINCVAWKGLAGVIREHLRKGDQVYVQGEYRTRSYTDREDKLRYSTEIEVNELRMLGGRRERVPGEDDDRDTRKPGPNDDIPF